MTKEVKITIKKGSSATRLDMAQWMRTFWKRPDVKAESLLYIIDAMIRGETWKPEYFDLNTGFEKCPFFNIEVTEEPADDFESFVKQQDEYHELCIAGADGDRDAAVEYCRLILAGKVNFSPRG